MGGYVTILKHTPDKEDRDTETDSETNTTDTVSGILSISKSNSSEGELGW